MTASTRVSDALEIAKTRLTEFDSKNQLSSSAADYMAPHIARAQEAALRIAEVAKTLRTSAEVPVAGMTAALGHGAAAVNQLRVKAAEYDQVRALLQLLVPHPLYPAPRHRVHTSSIKRCFIPHNPPRTGLVTFPRS